MLSVNVKINGIPGSLVPIPYVAFQYVACCDIQAHDTYIEKG